VTISQIFTRTRGPITMTPHKAGCNPKIESECVLVEIVTESETCHSHKVVLLTIKVVAHNASGENNS
jgi:hypothetical protein